ncbi:MAG: glycosyltransferase [Candidatus Eremiobacter antarcticus]
MPLRTESLHGLDELTSYLDSLHGLQVIVVDGSPPAIFSEHARRWGVRVWHMPPRPHISGRNGKVRGVLTGLAVSTHDKVIIADDDVRYDSDALAAVLAALDRYDVVRPQNYFLSLPWHAVCDTARTLLNRVSGGDWPGTLGVRRRALLDGYDADVLFENLELENTVIANGGRALVAYDVYVGRRAPTTKQFWSQRVRQAYDEFARPHRLAAALAVVPAVGMSMAGRRYKALLVAAILCMVGAEAGRRKAGGHRYFPALASVAAPVWVLERGLCAWIALLLKVGFGGVRYGEARIAKAASAVKELRARRP